MIASNQSSMLDKALSVASEENLYYYGSRSLRKSKIPTVQRTNFVQTLASKSGGQSVITISPDAGLSHVLLGLQLPAVGGSLTYEGMALPRGWAYSAIDFVQWRYGSSSLYQKSGQQLMIEAIATAGSQSESNALMDLAGNALYQTSDFAGNKLNAFCVLPLPHCGAQSGTETPNPFPSELLNAPIVITVALKRLQDIIAVNPATESPVYPTAFEDAYLQVRQVNPIDRGQLMSISSSHTYAFPTIFYQQANSVSLANTLDSQEVVLTGFRSGSCKGIHCWVIDTDTTTTANTAKLLANPNGFILPLDLELSYAGNVIHRYKSSSAQIMDTLFCDVPSYINNTILTADASPATTWSASDTVSSWVHFPLSQRFEQLSAEFTDVSGLAVANGVMNLRLRVPVAKSTLRLYYVPYYSVALVMNSGMCDYVF